ncbi:hypothetical protein QTP88_028362 [Uroleucon formosanum]
MGVSSQDTMYRSNTHGNSKGPKKYNPAFYTKRKRFVYPPPCPITPPHNTQSSWKKVPPKPKMLIETSGNMVTLTWNLTLTRKIADIKKYELFVCVERDRYPCTSMWVKKGNIEAERLPMGCDLQVFESGYTYHFALRAVDIHNRRGPFVVRKIYA